MMAYASRGRRTGPALVLAVIMFMAGGCSLLPRSQPHHVSHYKLEPAIPTAVEPAGDDLPVIHVSTPDARPDLATARMPYRRRDFGVDYFARNQWIDTPANMLRPLLVDALEASGRFGAVLQGGVVLVPDLRLGTELIAFEQDFRVKPSVFRLRLRAQLVDVGKRRVIASRVFEYREPAPADTPYGGVQAANRAVQQLLTDVSGFCLSNM